MVHRNAENEMRTKLYIQAGLASLLPIAFITKTPDDDALILRLMSAVNDPIIWGRMLDLFLGPKP